MLTIGILSSWAVPCGISQFSARQADALTHQGLDVTILALRADEHRSVPPDTGNYGVVDVGQIGMWRDDQQYALDVEHILSLDLDALLVNYEQMLVNREPLLDLARRFPGPTGIIWHDNCIGPDFDYSAFDLHFTHRWNVGPTHLPDCQIIPFGIEDRPPVVRTFGLGRTRWDYIAPICERHGWIFESAASHEPIQGGGQRWMSHKDLISWLRDADLLVLWYDDNGMAGSSQAARTAMASRRPLITNDTSWFQDLPQRTSHYSKVSTLEQLETEMCATLENPYVSKNSWDRVAAMLVDSYRRCMSEVSG